MKKYRDQLQECIDTENLRYVKCVACQQKNPYCQKHDTICKSGVCRIERFFDNIPIEYKGYTAEASWDAEKRIYYGHAIEVPEKIVFCTTKLEQIETEFQKAVDRYLEEYPQDRDIPLPPPGGRSKSNLG